MTTRIEFDESESCSLEDAQALIDLLSRVTALEQAGIITNVYVTDDVLEASWTRWTKPSRPRSSRPARERKRGEGGRDGPPSFLIPRYYSQRTPVTRRSTSPTRP